MLESIILGTAANRVAEDFFGSFELESEHLNKFIHCRLCRGVWIYAYLYWRRENKPILEAFLFGVLTSWVAHLYLIGERMTGDL